MAAMSRWLKFVVMALVPVLLAGCGEGEIINLLPPGGTGVWPPDPDWQVIRPVSGDQELRDVVRAGDELVVAVGSAGLIIAWDGRSWRREESGTSANLNAVAACGDLIAAVGGDGTVVRRVGSRWQSLRVPGVGNLREIAAGQDTLWAVGDEGALVAVTTGGAARVALPVATGLYGVVAGADTLYVCGDESTLLARAGGRWSTLMPPPSESGYVRSVGVFPDGRLTAITETMHIREADGWHTEERFPFLSAERLKTAAGTLWLEFDSGLVAWLGAEGDWERHYLLSYSPGARVAPTVTGPIPVVARGGSISWWVEEHWIADPAGIDRTAEVIRCRDGDIVTLSRNGVGRPGPRGVETLASFGARVGTSTGWQWSDGRTADDLAWCSYDDILRFRNGASTSIAPCDTCEFRSVALLADGRLIVGADSGLFEIVDDQALPVPTPDILSNPGWNLQSGPDGAFVAINRRGMAYWGTPEALVDFGLGGGARYGGFLPDGTPVVVARGPIVDRMVHEGWYLATWQGVGNDPKLLPIDLPSDSAEASVAGCRRNASALFLWLVRPDLVLRFDGDAHGGDWALVAGPLPYDIDDLEIRDDGTIVAVDDRRERVCTHPGHRP